LQRIPYGETRSYTQIAETLGAPRAVRAVASACASNPVALAIPCHRVVQKGGSLAGYRWGLARKAALLEAEANAFAHRRDKVALASVSPNRAHLDARQPVDGARGPSSAQSVETQPDDHDADGVCASSKRRSQEPAV